MEFTCSQGDFSKALLMVGRIVSSKATLPVLSNVLLSSTDGKLTLSATNLEMSISVHTPANISSEGSVTVPARALGEFVSSLHSGETHVALDGKHLVVKTPYSRASFAIIDAEEFPIVPDIDNPVAFSMPRNLVRDALERVVFASAADEGRPVLTGVFFSFTPDSQVMVATDGFRLSLEQFSGVTFSEEKAEFPSVVVPSRALVELARALSETDKGDVIDILLARDGTQIRFSLGDIELYSRLVEGQYPDYKQILPQGFKTEVVVGKEELISAVKTAAIFARESGNTIYLRFQDEGVMHVVAEAELGENENKIDAPWSGEQLHIAFNARYLLEALSSLDVSQILLQFSGSESPGVIRVVDDENFLHLIMPVKTQD